MAFENMANFEDEPFGFHYKCIVRPPLSSLPHPTDNSYGDDLQDFRSDSKLNQKKINDEYDEKPASTRISKGKGVTFEKKVHWQTSTSSNTLALSPVSPFTPPDHHHQYQQRQQQPSRSYINVNTPSPELTGPQFVISPSNTATTPSSTTGKSTPRISITSDDPFSGKVKTPPSFLPTSEYYTTIDPGLPREEKIRQLVLMLLRHNLDKQSSVITITDDDDDIATRQEVTRNTYVQRVWKQVIEKLSNREMNPFGTRPGKDSVYIYAEPNPVNERHLKKLQSCKQLYAALKEEEKDRQKAIYDVYEYSAKAEDLRETLYSKDTINLGSCHDYIHLMDEDQQAFIAEHQQWKNSTKKRLCDNDDDDTSSSSAPLPTLQELVIRKSTQVSQLRQLLHLINERQKRAGQAGDQLLTDIKARLKQQTLFFPTIDKPLEADQPSSSSHTTTNTENQDEPQMRKKRRLLGLENNIEMYGNRNFELLQNMSKFK